MEQRHGNRPLYWKDCSGGETSSEDQIKRCCECDVESLDERSLKSLKEGLHYDQKNQVNLPNRVVFKFS